MGLGDHRQDVREALGPPQETGAVRDNYFSHGIVIYYDRYDETVDGLLATRLKSGIAFDGSILGVSLGDTFEFVCGQIGMPRDWGLPHRSMSVATWELNDDKLLITYLLRSKSDWAISPNQELGTIQAVAYCKVKSFVTYEAVVSIAIAQIVAGLRPSRLEDMAIIEVDLEAKFFQKEYELISTRLALMGGAETIAAFADGTFVKFWLYPLAGEFPVIRALSRPKMEKKKEVPRESNS